MQCKVCNAEVKESFAIKDDPELCDSCHMQKFGRFGRAGYGVKIPEWSPSNVDPEVEFRHMGID